MVTSFGFQSDSFWFLFSLENSGDQSLHRYLEVDIQGLNTVELFDFDSEKLIFESGFSKVLEKPSYDRNQTIRIDLQPQTRRSYLLRINSYFSLTTAIHIHDKKSLESRKIDDAWRFGGYFGVILFCCIFDLCLFLILKHKPYFHYTFVVFFFHGTFVAANYGFLKYYLFPQDTWFNQRAILWAIAISHIWAVYFIRSMFPNDSFPKYFEPVAKLIVGICATTIIASLFSMNKYLGSFIVAISLPLIIFYFIIFGRFALRGSAAGGLAAFGWFFLLAANAVYILIASNVFSIPDLQTFQIMTMSAIIVGNTTEVIFMSFSVAYQFNEIRIQNARERELRRLYERRVSDAKIVQETFLMEQIPPPGFKLKSFSDFPENMGGDWFGSFYIKDRSMFVAAIVDVNGHGIASALMSGAIHGAFYSCEDLLANIKDPEECVNLVSQRMNKTVLDTGKAAGLWATACIAVFDRENQVLVIANHGHPPPMIKTSEGLSYLPLPSSPLGSREQAFGKVACFDLSKGLRFILYTDGWVENSRKFGFKKLKQALDRESFEEVAISFAAIKEQYFQESCEDDSAYLLMEVA